MDGVRCGSRQLNKGFAHADLQVDPEGRQAGVQRPIVGRNRSAALGHEQTFEPDQTGLIARRAPRAARRAYNTRAAGIGHFSCCTHRSVQCAASHRVMNKSYSVRAEWDEVAAVWVATSDDVPGLVTESETLEALDTKLRSMVPELLDANGCMPVDGQVIVELLARRISVALPAAA